MASRVSFELANETYPLLLVDVTANEKGPFRFAVDTGASITVISEELAESLGLPRGYEGLSAGTSGRGKATLTTLKSLAVGDRQVRDLKAAIMDLSSVRQAVAGISFRLDGILGYGFLSKSMVTIDYVNRTLTLDDPAPANCLDSA